MALVGEPLSVSRGSRGESRNVSKLKSKPQPLGNPVRVALRDTTNIQRGVGTQKKIPTVKPKEWRPNFSVDATSLFEVLSVSIHTAFDDGYPIEMYGSIRVTNSTLGAAAVIYDRDQDEPESVCAQQTTLLLKDPKDGGVIIPSNDVTVELDLKDRVRNIDIAKGSFQLDCTPKEEDYYGEYNHIYDGVECVRGQQGCFAKVRYSTTPLAVIAKVEVLYCDFGSWLGFEDASEEDDFDENTNHILSKCAATGDGRTTGIYGSITAGKDDVQVGTCLLFQRSLSDCAQVKPRTFITLSRCVVAVPAYASLAIKLDLWARDSQSQIAKGVVKIRADRATFTRKSDVIGKDGFFRVRVTWDDGYLHLHKHKELQLMRSIGPFSDKDFARSEILMEFYSISVCCKDSQQSKTVHGKIVMSEHIDACLYNRKQVSPQICSSSSGTLLKTRGPHQRCFIPSDYSILFVKLQTAGDRIISQGRLGWQANTRKLWYFDKRACSVIRGDHGYAVLHYCVFSDGVQAKVKILLQCNSPMNFGTRIHGKLVARYGGNPEHTYTTSYEKKYFQSTLLVIDEEHDGPMWLPTLPSDLPRTSVAHVPLSKSVVCVPRKSSLIVEASMTVTPVDDMVLQAPENLCGSVELLFDDDGTPQTIRGGNYSLQISVEWKGSRDLPVSYPCKRIDILDLVH